GFSASHRTADFDFYRFLGHELFVTFISFLIRDERWELLAELVERDIYVENTSRGEPGLVAYTRLSGGALWLQQRKQRLRSNQLSIQADILKERHSSGVLSEVAPLRQFMDADYFLFLRDGLSWHP